ncbi:MAG: hypothetical protein DRP74_00685 [Candidatus Omnitrophota bacterium]|nr:MAG: hypothetical protein DRP74_00685 [Candidatus Omnitrophota bacterium]
MTNREKLRLLIGDKNKIMVNDQFGVGDGSNKYFQLSMYPVRATTEVIVLNNSSQTRDIDYTIDNDTGLITMTSAPSNGAILKAQKYEYNAFSDDELDQILSDYGNDINMAAAHCCRALATNAAKFFVYWSGDEKVDKTKECQNFLRMAEAFEQKAKEEQAASLAVGVLRTEIYSENEDDYTGIYQD